MRKLRFFDMINEYLSFELERMAHEIETKKRHILERFAFYLDKGKRKPWKIDDITESDMRSYYNHLKQSEKGTGETVRKIHEINRFMDYAVKMGWLDKRPWKELYPGKKSTGEHLRISKNDRDTMLDNLKPWRPSEFFEKRNRALLLLILRHALRKTEISSLDLDDYDGASIKVTSPFEWRSKSIPLGEHEIEAIEEYLKDRRQRDEAPLENALFIGYKRGRIAPGMVKKILEMSLQRVKKSPKKNLKKRRVDK